MENKNFILILFLLIVSLAVPALASRQEVQQDKDAKLVNDLADQVCLNNSPENLAKLTSCFQSNKYRSLILQRAEEDYARSGSTLLLSRLLSARNELALKLLKSKNKLHKKITILALSSYSEEIIVELRKLLNCEDSEIIFAAIHHLGKAGDTHSEKQIANFLGSEELLPTALKALARIGSKQCLSQVSKFLHSRDLLVRSETLKAVVAIDPGNSFPQLVKSIEDNEWQIRVLTLKLLQSSENPKADSLILKSSFDPSEDVRVQAVKSLGVGKIQSAIPRLIELLKDPSAEVRGESAMSLILLNSTKSGRDIEVALQKEKMVYALRRMIISLGYLGNKDTIKSLKALENHKHYLVREEIQKSILRIEERK